MESTEEILKFHACKYRDMQPQDCIKLLYQSQFAGGHIIENSDISLKYLQDEMDGIQADPEEELSVPVGSSLCRINLAKAKTLYTPEQINDWFVRTANVHRGSFSEFFDTLRVLKKNISLFSFSQEEFDAYFAWYRSEGFPAVHHSEKYRNEYHPHYRVIYQNLWKQ